MTYKIISIYDQVRSELTTLFPGKTEIVRPGSLENNVTLFLKNGWGVIIGESGDGVVDTLCNRSEARNISIVLTNEVFQIDNSNTNDIEITKAQLIDFEKIKDKFENPLQLGIADKIQQINFENQSEVEFKIFDKFNFISGRISFSFEITEELQ